jgi:lambda family phage minor tail protein L
MSINSNLVAGSKKIISEASLFSPTSLVTFYELDFRTFGINRDDIDLAELTFKNNLTSPYNDGNGYISSTADDPVGVLRFHNLNINVENSSSNSTLGSLNSFGQIIWQNKRYIPFPIMLDGIETASRGTLPKPKLTFTNQIQNSSYNFFFTKIKNTIRSIGDIIGLEVTRKRTFLKYLDAVNFKSYGGIINDDNFIIDPDSYAALADDIFYVDRKLKENKEIIQYELSSIIDLENLKLPLRTMYSESCSLDYRGDGCEYGNNVYSSSQKNSGNPIATDKDENITDLLNGTTLTAGSPVIWSKTPVVSYSKGQFVYVVINDIKYFFVSKTNGNTFSPFNSNYWLADLCSKRLKGCRKRYGTNGELPFGGFPATSKEA